MKKIIILLLITAFVNTAHSQSEMIFKLQYKPEMTYNQTIEQETESVITYKGPKDVLQVLQEKGIENPTVSTKKSTRKTDIKTGTLNGEHFPVTMEFISAESSDGKKEVPDGTTVYGKAKAGAMPVMDSIASTELSDEFKKTFLQTIQSTLDQISYPEKKLKIGENFSSKTPISIPVAGTTLDMVITTNYKLLKISDGVATFDIVQVCTMKAVISDYNTSATGRGKGKMTYDLVNDFYTRYTMDFEMDMKMKLDKFDMSLKTQNKYIQTTVINKNGK